MHQQKPQEGSGPKHESIALEPKRLQNIECPAPLDNSSETRSRINMLVEAVFNQEQKDDLSGKSKMLAICTHYLPHSGQTLEKYLRDEKKIRIFASALVYHLAESAGYNPFHLQVGVPSQETPELELAKHIADNLDAKFINGSTYRTKAAILYFTQNFLDL